MDLDKLAAVAAQLGLSGAELREWIEREQVRQRDERAAEREEAKEAAERQRLADERQRLADERQLQILQLKLQLQESAQSQPSAAAALAPSANPSCLNPQKLLPLFDERRDDLHAYLQRFERVATGQEWPREKWGVAVSMCLTGEALTVIGRMTADEALDYDKVKKALLQRFRFTAQGYKDKFRKARPEDGETGKQLAARISSYFDNWIEMADVPKTFEGLRDHVIAEQFLRCCNPKLAIFLKERECKTLTSLSECTDRFLEAQGVNNIGKIADDTKEANKPGAMSQYKQPSCFLCHRKGHSAPDCRAVPKESVKCKTCGRLGHKATDCKDQSKDKSVSCAMIEQKKQDYFPMAKSKDETCAAECPKKCENQPMFLVDNMPVVEGRVLGQRARVLRDTGSNTTIVRREFVPDRCLTGKTARVMLLDGKAKELPEANIQIHTPYFVGDVNALCMTNPLYDLVLGNIPGVKGPQEPDTTWEYSDALFPESTGSSKIPACWEKSTLLSAVVRTQGKTESMMKIPLVGSLEVTRVQLTESQKDDPSLKSCFSKIGKEFHSNKDTTYHFSEEAGLLYRHYRLSTGRTFKQVVVPRTLRQHILKVAHEGIMAGHQGVRRTTDRILGDFYWPGMHEEIRRFVKSCDVCQRTTPKGKVGVAPLGNMPLIRTPFQRVAIDLIGPLSPRSDKGNRYVLTLIDFATRYPDAVALPSIDAVSIAEALLEIFSRVGLPREVVTDQGRSFTSELMKEVGRLLTVKFFRTTPYHAMANGLVEKFNGTLKAMLKRVCQEKPRSWDRYIAPLLFAYREVPQASLGFSPFELIYGRHVRGPLSVLRELWTNENIEDEVRTTYTYLVDLRNRLEHTCNLAHEELGKAREKQKLYYDRKTRHRRLRPGDKVLILLPTDTNKLLMQWKGPFKVAEAKNDVDYAIDLGQSIKVFHVNMLKKYEERETTSPHQVAAVNTTSATPGEEANSESNDSEDTIPSLSLCQTQTASDVKISPKLQTDQLQQVRQLCEEFADIFSDLPGKTQLVECSLDLVIEKPVHVPQYPIPLALRENVEKEVQEMLRMGIIEKSKSPYHAPIVVVKKPDNTIRLCIDFRELNKTLVFDSEPIPRIDVVLALVGKQKFFSKFDFTKGYWQVPMAPDSREKTAFSSMSGLYHFKYMPFGIKTAPAIFARLMRRVLGDLPNVHHYFDDVVIATSTWHEHMEALRLVFERIRNANLTIKPSKCEIGERTITFLGHRIGEAKVEPMLKTLDKILAAKRPTTKKAVQSFLGLTGYYRQFIPNYAEISKPLTDLTKKGQHHIVSWGPTQEKAFTVLKDKLAASPILQTPDLSKPFVLRTDASSTSIGAVLLQNSGDDILHPVAYASRNLLPREARYSTIERECLALVWAVQKFHIYLCGKPFIIQCDHQPLRYLQSAKHVNNRVLRWSLLMQEYSFTVEYIKGSDNVGADYLSRI